MIAMDADRVTDIESAKLWMVRHDEKARNQQEFNQLVRKEYRTLKDQVASLKNWLIFAAGASGGAGGLIGAFVGSQ